MEWDFTELKRFVFSHINGGILKRRWHNVIHQCFCDKLNFSPEVNNSALESQAIG